MTVHVLTVETGSLSFNFLEVELRLNKLFVEVKAYTFTFPSVTFSVVRQQVINAMSPVLTLQSSGMKRQVKMRVSSRSLFLQVRPTGLTLRQELQFSSTFPTSSPSLTGTYPDD